MSTNGRHDGQQLSDNVAGQRPCQDYGTLQALGCDMTSDDHGRAYILEHQGSPRAFIPTVVTLSGYAG